jgi:hypothetical protein
VTYVSRRLFVQGAGGLCLGLLAGCARPFEAASSNRVYRIGVLFGARTAASPEAEAFRQGLQEHGWREGEDVTLEYGRQRANRSVCRGWPPSWSTCLWTCS